MPEAIIYHKKLALTHKLTRLFLACYPDGYEFG